MERSIQAEQALLGAVLSDAVGQQHVLDWLCPDDMHRPYHGQVLAAMQRLRARGVPPGPHEVRAELGKDPHLPATVARDGVRLVELMERSPREGHAPAYAAMVIDASIHDGLGLAGSRLAQAAEAGNLDGALRQARQARRDAEAAAARWEALPEQLRRELPVPGRDATVGAEIARRAKAVRDELARLRDDMWVTGSHDVQERLAGIAQQIAETAALSASRTARRQAAAEARPHSNEAHAAGERALRDLAAGPQHLSDVQGWLKPPHFASRRHGELYQLMADLHAAGRPVDPVTVSWEAARRGVAMTPEQVSAAVAGGTAAFAVPSARSAHEHGVLAQTAQAGCDIQAQASDPASSPRLLLRATRQRLCDVQREHVALEAARQDPQPAPRPTREPTQALSASSNGPCGARSQEAEAAST